MNNKALLKQLKDISACSKAVEWVNGMDFKTAWKKCERADYLLWYICKAEIGTRRDRIHAICDCAQTAMKYIPKGEKRPQEVIKAAREYADKPTPENLKRLKAVKDAVWDAVRDTAWTTETVWAAVDAAMAAGAAAEAVTAARAAGAAKAAAVDAARAVAAARVAARVVWGAAGVAAHQKMCKLIRKRIKIKDGA